MTKTNTPIPVLSPFSPLVIDDLFFKHRRGSSESIATVALVLEEESEVLATWRREVAKVLMPERKSILSPLPSADRPPLLNQFAAFKLGLRSLLRSLTQAFAALANNGLGSMLRAETNQESALKAPILRFRALASDIVSSSMADYDDGSRELCVQTEMDDALEKLSVAVGTIEEAIRGDKNPSVGIDACFAFLQIIDKLSAFIESLVSGNLDDKPKVPTKELKAVDAVAVRPRSTSVGTIDSTSTTGASVPGKKSAPSEKGSSTSLPGLI
ncbi:hypothetical protein HK101_001786 [Irineochytrium annulatum]|nr:hypothetical protein HK101_001786 [Irineochytrium annulatum]